MEMNFWFCPADKKIIEDKIGYNDETLWEKTAG